jgi:hypothetical protein
MHDRARGMRPIPLSGPATPNLQNSVAARLNQWEPNRLNDEKKRYARKLMAKARRLPRASWSEDQWLTDHVTANTAADLAALGKSSVRGFPESSKKEEQQPERKIRFLVNLCYAGTDYGPDYEQAELTLPAAWACQFVNEGRAVFIDDGPISPKRKIPGVAKRWTTPSAEFGRRLCEFAAVLASELEPIKPGECLSLDTRVRLGDSLASKSPKVRKAVLKLKEKKRPYHAHKRRPEWVWTKGTKLQEVVRLMCQYAPELAKKHVDATRQLLQRRAFNKAIKVWRDYNERYWQDATFREQQQSSPGIRELPYFISPTLQRPFVVPLKS